MNKKEFEAVINLPSNVRYEYFIKKVADYEEVWGLYDNGWAVTSDPNGNLLLPFWPKKEFAEACAIEDWKNYKAESIDLSGFIEEFLPQLKEDGIKPSIFFNNDDSAVLEVNTLIEDIETELEKY
ncbi:DUF2750 domain-containing protein (plasmid) [Paenibacillus urinalis]|uniref:DUF2750 domain-containing protein n=1 Tax=Paenibacillus urinalis TaxID=521520 RepID=A0AAX3N8H4_9BACL|nr:MULTISPECIES: DUF2750 domain-containing protein [Paenibacillus]MCM3130562.1 DUF2750 domain-containing protein [Paenibacillus sp. MER 78]WDH85449.1 DUF2750 domain-containing protein [Paenibacillus urinalis]WDH95112.1 DUF2750 domain-containing protein [Paenibacillus urinalis]WDI05415.1 DUF2750 domain-containing protein [Paenibacillus urinalis]